MVGQSGPLSNGNEGVLRIPQSPTIKLFSVISRTLIGGGLTPLQKCSRCILQPQPTGQERHQGKWSGSYKKNTQQKKKKTCQ